MRTRNLVTLALCAALAVASLSPSVQAANAFSAAAIQAWKQSITAAGYMGAPRYTTALLPACTSNANRGALAYDTTAGSLVVCSGSAWVSAGGVSSPISGDYVATGKWTFGSALDAANSVRLGETAGAIVGEGATADANETTIAFGDAGADQTLTITATSALGTEIQSTGAGITLSRTSGGTHLGAAAATLTSAGNLLFYNGLQLCWVSAGSTSLQTPGTCDLTETREAAAILQLGVDVNGAAVAQTLKAHDGITGSNIAGANLTLASGRGTGNAAASSVHIQVPNMLGTGTTAQTLADRVVACESKTLSNTTATATTIANVALASNSSGAAKIAVSVQCNDGTNFDSDIVTSYVAYVNKATVVTVGTPVTTGTAAANNSGSCTVAPTFVANGNSIDIKVTPVITTITPTTTTAYVNVESFGAGAVTCQ